VKPYYERDGITIYHGNCLDVLPALDKADLVLTDPPYGIRKWNSSGGQSLSEEEAETVNQWDALPSQELLDAVVGAGNVAIIWGGNYLCGLLGPFRTPLIWDKKIRGMHFADGEMAWTNFDFGTLRICELPIAGHWKRKEHGARADMPGEERMHPTQKPVALMRWCIVRSKTTGLVLDPFLGSGSTLVACKAINRPAIGIEMSEEYCEIAAKRIERESFQEPFCVTLGSEQEGLF